MDLSAGCPNTYFSWFSGYPQLTLVFFFSAGRRNFQIFFPEVPVAKIRVSAPAPWKTVSDPTHLGTFCPPPYSISLSKSLRNAQNFPQLTSSETIFGGSRKMVSDRPSSRGFAFRYVLPPPPFSSVQMRGRLWCVCVCVCVRARYAALHLCLSASAHHSILCSLCLKTATGM